MKKLINKNIILFQKLPKLEEFFPLYFPVKSNL